MYDLIYDNPGKSSRPEIAWTQDGWTTRASSPPGPLMPSRLAMASPGSAGEAVNASRANGPTPRCEQHTHSLREWPSHGGGGRPSTRGSTSNYELDQLKTGKTAAKK